MKRAVRAADYYELGETGHCPAHEAPEATNACVAAFVSRCEKKNNLHGAETSSSSNSAAARFLVDGAPRNAFERLAAWRETRA